MKKLIFTLAGISLSSFLFAQFSSPMGPLVKGYPEPSATHKVHAPFSKSSLSAWYSHLEFIRPSMGATLGNASNNSLFFTSNDSLFKIVGSDSVVNHIAILGFGQVLDPKDAEVGNSSTAVQLTKNNPYTLDSIGFKYFYVRNVDANGSGDPIIDTLFIAYYKGTQITQTSFNSNKYATMQWNGTKRLPNNYTDLDTVLLDGFTLPPTTTSDNETRFGFSYVTFPAPAGIDVAANSLVGYTVTFKSGIPAVEGTDTAIAVYQLDPAITPAPARRANIFGSFISNDNMSTGGVTWSNPTYYNTSLIQTQWAGYGQNLNTQFKNRYLGGVLFSNNLFTDAYVKLNDGSDMPFAGLFITCNNVGLDDIKNDVFVMSNVYPNPARSTEAATLAFTLKQAGTVNISIINLVGQEVKSVLNKKYSAGSVTESLDLSGLKPGIYMINMNVNGSSMSQKLTIVE